MTDKEQFDVARELIRHEDGLINNRVTWLLVLQGFLFTAFVNGVGLYEKANGHPVAIICLTLGLVLIGLLGMASSITALNVMRIAFNQMENVKGWWKTKEVSTQFPPVAGGLGDGLFYKLFSAGRMPYFLTVTWVFLISLLLIGLSGIPT